MPLPVPLETSVTVLVLLSLSPASDQFSTMLPLLLSVLLLFHVPVMVLPDSLALYVSVLFSLVLSLRLSSV